MKKFKAFLSLKYFCKIEIKNNAAYICKIMLYNILAFLLI